MNSCQYLYTLPIPLLFETYKPLTKILTHKPASQGIGLMKRYLFIKQMATLPQKMSRCG